MKNTHKIYAMIIAMIMIISCFTTMLNNISFATEPNPDPQEGGEQELSFTVDFGSAAWVVNGVTVTAVSEWEPNLGGEPKEIGEGDRIRLNNFNNGTMQIVVRGENNFQTLLSLISDDETTLMSRDAEHLPSGTLTFTVEAKDSSDPSQPSEGQGQPGGEEDIEFDIEIEGTHVNMWINELSVISDENGVFVNEFKDTVEKAGTTNSAEVNIFSFCTTFGEKDVKEYIINGVTYTKTDAIGMGEDRIDFEIPGAAKYTIKIVADEDSEQIRTIIWANPNYVNDGIWSEEDFAEMQLKNGYGYIKEVYDENDKLVDSKEYIKDEDSELGISPDGFGYATPKPGYKVVFEFVPDYGYQLTDIKVNGQSIGTGDRMNQFVFTMPDTNVHFTAVFSKTDDALKTESETVKDGTITLPENTLDAGTAQLRVKDIDLDESKIKNFEKVAEGYEIKTFLDIDLYQVFYKGKTDDEDVWENKIDELEKEVEISFKLQDGMKFEDVVIVHNIHDGDEYEVIEITGYDEKTNTITFKTKSFSSYAIATKGSEEEETITLVDETTKASIEFVDSDGHSEENFEFNIMDITNLSDDEIAELGIPKTEYEKGLEKIKENSAKEGTFIKLLNIQVRLPGEDRDVTDGPFKIKIPYTDDMKAFNEFKIAYVDSEDFSIKDIVELTVEGDYLVGILEHLSPYVLIGKVTETAEETAEDIGTSTSNNPSTGDNIVIFGSIFVLSTLAMAFEILVIKKSNLYR